MLLISSALTLSLPPRGAWIEMKLKQDEIVFKGSLPPRGAWIEMATFIWTRIGFLVAPPTGSVD